MSDFFMRQLKQLDPFIRKPSEIRTHDYTQSRWGHDYTTVAILDGGQVLELRGWGYGIVAGDYLVLDNRVGTTRYQVEKIKYNSNVKDMWSATCKFAPRE